MSRLEYLDILEQKLKKFMTQKEVNDIVRDYAEYFEEGKAQGNTDEETAAKLGSPEKIAEQILEENNYDMELNSVPKEKKHLFTDLTSKVKNMFSSLGNGTKTVFNKFKNGIKKLNIPNFMKNLILIIIGIPLALILALAGICIGIAVILAVLLAFVGLLTIGIVLFIPGILLIASAGIVWDFFYISIPILAIISGVGCLALGLCFIGLSLVICQNVKKFILNKSKKIISAKTEGCENNE